MNLHLTDLLRTATEMSDPLEEVCHILLLYLQRLRPGGHCVIRFVLFSLQIVKIYEELGTNSPNIIAENLIKIFDKWVQEEGLMIDSLVY